MMKAAGLLIFLSLQAHALIHKASFDQTYARYPSPFAVIQEFHQIAPRANFDDGCFQINAKSAPMLGTMDPVRGEALEKTPGDLFYQYYQTCVRALTSQVLTGYESPRATKDIVGEHYEELAKLLYKECRHTSALNLWCPILLTNVTDLESNFWKFVDWSQVSHTFKVALVRAFTEYLVGPDEILAAQGYTGESTAFGRPIRNRAELTEFLVAQMDQLASATKGGLKMVDVYADIAIILRLGPALKG